MKEERALEQSSLEMSKKKQYKFDFILCNIIEKCKAQEDFEIVTKVLDPNDLGVVRRMFPLALTKSIKAKVQY